MLLKFALHTFILCLLIQLSLAIPAPSSKSNNIDLVNDLTCPAATYDCLTYGNPGTRQGSIKVKQCATEDPTDPCAPCEDTLEPRCDKILGCDQGCWAKKRS